MRPISELDFNRTVEVRGEVRFPGRYPIRRAETLSSLLERAGGYTSKLSPRHLYPRKPRRFNAVD